MASASFLQALVERYDAVKTAQGLPSALWFGEAPEQTAYPRAVLRHGGETPFPGSYDETSGQPIESEAAATIFIESTSLATAESLAKKIMQQFTPASISMAQDSGARMFRTTYQVDGSPDRTQAGLHVYTASVSFRAVFGTDY